MHPNPLFQSDEKALMRKLIDDIGFGMIAAASEKGLNVAHTPFLRDGEETLLFHLARKNAITPHLDGKNALAIINGPHSYISPRWYADRATVPTWNYVAVKLEGTVRRIECDELDTFLYHLIERHEERVTRQGASGDVWRADEAPEQLWYHLRDEIIGFALDIKTWQSTLKLSQNKSPADIGRIRNGLMEMHAHDMAHMMASPTECDA